MALANIVKKNEIDGSEFKNGKKSGKKIVKIFAKSNSWNLPKFKFGNLSQSKKVHITGTINKYNFLIFNTRVVFTKLK